MLTLSDLDRSWRKYFLIFGIFAAEFIALNIFKLPDSLNFDGFAFCDSGANLTLQYLIANGYRPTIDFGYHYGLLPIAVGQLWFGFFGRTPLAYQALMVVCGLLIVTALARIAASLRFGGFGLALMIIALGIAVQTIYPSEAQAIEAVLLSTALAEQAAGRRASALGLACAAVFAKPSMGFVYGLLVLALAAREILQTGSGLTGLVRFALPAALTGAILAVTLAALYGPVVVIRTVLPFEGAAAYNALHYGFFSAGREFWDPQRMPRLYYLVHLAGFWITSSIFLIGCGIAAVIHFRRTSSKSDLVAHRRSEIILTCAVVQIVFVLVMFGNQWSWVYYSYFLIVGIAAAADSGPWRRRISLVLCTLAILSWTDEIYWVHRWWQVRQPDAITAHLWSTAEERAEWTKALGEARGRKTVILDTKGAAELMFPQLEKPVSLFLDPGLMNTAEIQRKVDQLSSADLVVVPVGMPTCGGIPEAPEFESAMKQFQMVFAGKFFEVYGRGDASVM
ncbi:MAG: hypothetical protein ACREQR_01770 [Candidatus Binataceae bacterium]